MKSKIDTLFIITLTLLVGHQIDAAYWKEWEMFLLPGGIQLFDIFNLALIPILLVGFKAVVLRKKSGYYHSLLLSFLGILTISIHSGFMLYGHRQFMLPVSMGIIVASGLFSVLQLLVTVKSRNEFINA